MIDTTGRQLAVNDKVAFIRTGNKSLGVGIVSKLTPKGATIQIGTDRTGNPIKLPRDSTSLCFISNAT